MFAQPVKIDYKPVSELWSIDNAVFTTFIFWSSVLIVKTLFMVVLTAFQRFKNQVINLAPFKHRIMFI